MTHYIIITGATRGFGKSIALSFAKSIHTPVHFSLTGRTAGDLDETKREIHEIRDRREWETVCDLVVADLADLSGLPSVCDIFMKELDSDKYSTVIFISNAGSLGPLTYIGTGEGSDLSLISSTVNFNVTSSIYLTSEVVRRYSRRELSSSSHAKVRLVNVSSLCAVQPFDSWGIYCAGKAARDMYYRVLAEEFKPMTSSDGTVTESNVKVLNYAPGPLDTEMQREIRESSTAHKPTQEFYISMKEKGILVSADESAERCVWLLLQADKFKSGDHVDFYDVPAKLCACLACSCGSDCRCGAESKPQCDACVSVVSSAKKASGCSCESCGCGANCRCGPECQCGSKCSTQSSSTTAETAASSAEEAAPAVGKKSCCSSSS